MSDDPSSSSSLLASSASTSAPKSSKNSKMSAPSSKSIEGKTTEGKIALEIGTGDSAKDSFVYLTIKWSFLIGSLTTVAIFFKDFFGCGAAGNMAIVDVVKNIWSVFMPVITLALGYAFGKGR